MHQRSDWRRVGAQKFQPVMQCVIVFKVDLMTHDAFITEFSNDRSVASIGDMYPVPGPGQKPCTVQPYSVGAAGDEHYTFGLTILNQGSTSQG